jgi:hypothetical protein
MNLFEILYGIQLACWVLVIAGALQRYVPSVEFSGDSLAKVFVAFAVLPHWLGIFSLAVIVVAPVTAAWQYGISIFAAWGMLLLLQRDVSVLMADVISTFRLQEAAPPMISLLLVLSAVIPAVWTNYSAPLSAHDSLIYAYEARLLVESAGVSSLPFFGSRVDAATVVNHPHGPFFSGYLAQAYFAGDAALSFAYQFTIPCMLFGLSAFGRSTGLKWAATAAVLGFFMVKPSEYISLASSRDAFRISVLAALAAFLMWHIRLATVVSFAGRLTAALAVFLSVAAHALNLIFLPFIILAAAITGWAHWRSILIVTRWLLLPGTMLVLMSMPYAVNLFRYGNPLGLGVYFPYYKDTPLWEAFISYGHWGGDPSFRELLAAIAGNYGVWQSCSIVASIVLCFCLFFFHRKSWQLMFIGGFGLAMIVLPLLLAIKIGEVNLSGAFATNVRYPLSTFAFLGIFLYVPICSLISNNRLTRLHSSLPAMLLVIFLLAGVLYGCHVVRNWQVASNAEQVLEEGEWQVVELSRQVSTGSTWYTSQFSPAFYATADIRPRFLLSDDGYGLYAKKDVDAILSNLREKNVGMVSLIKNKIYPWHATTLYMILSGCDGIKHHELLRWDVFLFEASFDAADCRSQLQQTD